jgi:hypothetical protein
VPELLELVEAAFDEVAFLVFGFAAYDAVVRMISVGVRRAVRTWIPDPVGIISLVGDDVGYRRQVVEHEFG